ncbi:MAG: cytochrome c, partial [Myxococcales bacterium]|nr:cytochrome c [Myxococcales bacterium]
TSGVFRGGPADTDLYRTLTTGLDGTPMPAYGGSLTEEERWALVDYIRFLSSRSFLTWFLWDPPE